MSIWHWVVTLVVLGVPLFIIAWTGKRKVDPIKGPMGFGGWLLLLAIWQVLAPLATLLETVNGMAAYEEFQSVPSGRLVAIGEPSINFAFLALQLVVLWSMLKKSKEFPRLFFYQWIAIPIVFIVDILLVSSALGVGVSEMMTRELVPPSARAFVWTGVWVWYLSKSVRVRNTFVH